jgi:hypothetical protein
MDYRLVQWVYVLDSGQRSSVTVKHPPVAAPLPYGWPGGIGEEDDEGRIEPSVLRAVTRADVYATELGLASRVHIIYVHARADVSWDA